jgi:uncharacterized protein YjeT (DUF2065 family)
MSMLLANILGIYFFTIGLSIMLRPQQFKKMEQFVKDDSAMLLGAIIGILFGAVIISLHNIWIMGWPVIITILGWWSLIKGFGIMTFPSFLERFTFFFGRSDSFYRITGLLYAAVGAFLLFHGMQ